MSKSDYYSEETTLQAPGSRTAPSSGGMKLYGRDLRDYDDNDLETLLGKLSTDELEDLNNDFDPDNSLLPPSQRCKDQTDKTATGPYQREKLLNYLEESAKNEKDWEEHVPFSSGVKRGKVYEEGEDGLVGGGSGLTGGVLKKKEDNIPMPIELDLDDDEELDTALVSAPERDLVDLAGILGMHNVLNQSQYHNVVKGKSQDENTGTSFNNIVKAYQPRVVPDEGENETDVEDCLKRLVEDDSALTEVNINNMKRVSKERIRNLISAATHSKHITKLSMSNTAIGDSEARGLVELLEESPSLKTLNIESNFISPELLAKILKAALKKQVLVEIHAENQRQSVLGNQIEMDIMMSIEENESLLRVGIGFQSMEARHRVSEALERNYERVRLRRLGKTV
uniref:Tropomodulin n=1 Tax=Panagrolaimus sp. PS1159 TaxID=55785 RepID=A0AC35FCP3_9BILA